MTAKATKPLPTHADLPAVEADERHQADLDGFIARNRDALNASIRRARAEAPDNRQDSRSISDIIADGRKRHAADE